MTCSHTSERSVSGRSHGNSISYRLSWAQTDQTFHQTIFFHVWWNVWREFECLMKPNLSFVIVHQTFQMFIHSKSKWTKWSCQQTRPQHYLPFRYESKVGEVELFRWFLVISGRQKVLGSSLMLVALSELVDSEGEKPTRSKTRNWVKQRKEHGYINNIT